MNRETPVIETARLRLEPFDIYQHLTDRYVEWLNDPDIVRFSEQRHRRHTKDSCNAFAQEFVGSSNHFWAIVAKECGPIHIGNLVAYIDKHNRVAELSILIGEAVGQGQGFGTEAWGAAIRHVIQVERMRKVFAGTMAENIAMLKVFSRSGMAIECRQASQLIFEGREVDLIIASTYAPGA